MLSLNDIHCCNMEQYTFTERTSPEEKAQLLIAFVEEKKNELTAKEVYERENIGLFWHHTKAKGQNHQLYETMLSLNEIFCCNMK